MGPYGPIYGPIWAFMGPYMGPCGPIWAHMGPCGPIWAHIGPPGQVLDFRKLSVRFPSTFRKTIWTDFGELCHRRTWALMGPYMGPYMGPCGPLWVLLDRSWKKRQLSVHFPYDIWTNFARFGSRNCILMKFINDSASFLLEKLKNHVILTKNRNISQKIQKIPKKSEK